MAEAEKKKPKIDLKARLGKKTISSAGGPSIPPPMGMPGGSIPAPPFGSRPSQPRPDPTDPYAAVAAEAPQEPSRPQEIRIEMSEEVVQAQKKGRSKIMMLAAGTAVVGGILGVAIGGGLERRTRQNIALEGAVLLAKDVDSANAEIEKLAEVLKKAKLKISENKLPTEEATALGAINIPFDGTKLVGKGIGLMSAEINRDLIRFAGDSMAANDQKERVKNLLGGASLKGFMDQRTNPKITWSVFVTNSPLGPIAQMQPVPGFVVKSDEKKDGKDYAWPEEFEVPDGDKKTKLKRYTKGEPMGGTPELIPVDPSTEGAVCSSDVARTLIDEISTLERLLRGDKRDPTNETLGLIDNGTQLMDKLKSIGHG